MIFPAAVVWLGTVLPNGGGLGINVGAMAAGGAQSVAALNAMQMFAGSDCIITVYEDEEQMRLDTAAMKLACSYLFADGGVTAYRSPMSATDFMTDLLAASAHVHSRSGEISAAPLYPYREIFYGHGVADIPAAVQSIAEEILSGGLLLEYVYIDGSVYESGARVEQAPQTYGAAEGAAALCALLAALFAPLAALFAQAGTGNASGVFSSNKKKETRLRSAGVSGVLLNLSDSAAVFVSSFLCLALIAAARVLFLPGPHYGLYGEFLRAAAYSFALAGFCALLFDIVPAGMYVAAVMLIFVSAALFGGAFFDFGEIFSSLEFVRYFFINYYFMQGMHGCLAAIGAACFALSFLNVSFGFASRRA
ncbi:MAG: hypothetical protein FWE82_00435 [Defluviitaleaceae bacterium]|nr:hypothetical protein [Defluviitaleaceae bacterium]